ncbi:TetR/AcrR family transcriptional regulator [Arthrobacter sp. ISL-48]|uniref:TetR/AcrR family transcriptional regulator n=1 Tax=Arthrobacter sp. ISL-48 TaxID=2819110 RepID=UPI001BE70E3C|nr:TetR/AcrR family transcriptional regulator [Arthrobacter sp. ISL-48]MBT2532942.1 TetR/AcrR family transcriptional regulator [Arthrobacter sp. ISL-48]
MDTNPARERILDAAEHLFYARGIQAVGMDVIRNASGVTLRRLYQLFPSKGDLVKAYLARRDARWLQSLARHVDMATENPRGRLLAVFDWLEDWFTQPDFHGCAFINSFGELGGTSPEVAAAARHHKDTFHAYLQELATAAGASAATGTQIALLAEGAMSTAAISGTPASASHAKLAAQLLLTPGNRNDAFPS